MKLFFADEAAARAKIDEERAEMLAVSPEDIGSTLPTCARARASGNWRTISASEQGSSAQAPSPWTARRRSAPGPTNRSGSRRRDRR
jgi:hypothetical protein